MKFPLPPCGTGVRWRAVGSYRVGRSARGKFPADFFRGKHSFGPTKAAGTAAGLEITREALESPEEADIWKIDGSTVYFFNQLRGLQVLDLANPADPRLTASLRLPAVRSRRGRPPR